MKKFKTNDDIAKGKSSPDAAPHPQPNTVTYAYLNRHQIPKKQDGKKQIYAILENNRVIGVGETTLITERIPNGYVYNIKTMKTDGSTIISEMQQRACELTILNKVYHFEVQFLEQVDRKDARKSEAKWIDHYRQLGEPILNKTRLKKFKGA